MRASPLPAPPLPAPRLLPASLPPCPAPVPVLPLLFYPPSSISCLPSSLLPLPVPPHLAGKHPGPLRQQARGLLRLACAGPSTVNLVQTQRGGEQRRGERGVCGQMLERGGSGQMLAVCRQWLASPTTKPPTSNFGTSSASHLAMTSRQVGGSSASQLSGDAAVAIAAIGGGGGPASGGRRCLWSNEAT